MKNKYGFKPPVIKIDEYFFGNLDVGRSLPKVVIRPDGQWDDFLPEDEMQRRHGLETYNCTNFGTLNALEIIIKALYGAIANYSERYLGVNSGTTKSGNSPHEVGEAIRDKGLIPEAMLPWSDDIKTWAKYYSPKPMTKKLLDVGKVWLSNHEFGHEWVYLSPKQLEADNRLLMEALTYSPLGISVKAWKKRNGLYWKNPAEADNHWVCLYGYVEGKYWKVFDSYDNTKKKLEWNYNFQFCKRYYLKANLLPEKEDGEGEADNNHMIKLIRETGLLREVNRPVYAVVNGKKFWVTSWDAMKDFRKLFGYESLEQAQQSVKEYPKSQIDGYPDGGPIGNLSIIDFMKVMFTGTKQTKLKGIMDNQLIKRLKSFAWRLGAYLLVAALAWIANNIGLLELPASLSTIIALVLGEVTKYLNKNVS